MENIIQKLNQASVSVSFGGWFSNDISSEDGNSLFKSAQVKNDSAMVKVAVQLWKHSRRHPIMMKRKKRMHVHIGGPKSGLSEVTVVEVNPHGVIKNRFYKIKCDGHETFNNMVHLAKTKMWNKLFDMVNTLRHAV